jgi:DNA-binding CsgD family transcriptional regulator
VLSLAARGHTNARIAALLGISVNSVKAHLKEAFVRLGICHRRQAPAWAVIDEPAVDARAAR